VREFIFMKSLHKKIYVENKIEFSYLKIIEFSFLSKSIIL
jgi:hypothetical protein